MRVIFSFSPHIPNKEKEVSVLPRVVEKTERAITETIERHLAQRGWVTTTLIHDELVIQRSSDTDTQQHETEALEHDTKVAIRRFEEARGWAPGTLDMNITTF